MTSNWTRTSTLENQLSGEFDEVWELHDACRVIESYPVSARYGKPFDVLGLKSRTSESLLSWVADVSQSVEKLYGSNAPKRKISECPCCKAKAVRAHKFCAIHGVEYKKCSGCGHAFVANQPTEETLNQAFRENDSYSNHYTDEKMLETRLAEIIAPKFDWVQQAYRNYHGRELTSVVDVGAGGGHFVGYCDRLGLNASGYELSAAATKFADKTFGVQLRNENYLTESIQQGEFDLVTFWGLLEYTPDPSAFVAAARKQSHKDSGMLILEVPRVDALSTAIQTQFPDTVWRHVSPSSHMNIFSDSALAHLLHRNGFKPISAWYFGMDVYELFSQISMNMKDDRIMDQMAHLISPLQQWMDSARLCDDIIVAAVPV